MKNQRTVPPIFLKMMTGKPMRRKRWKKPIMMRNKDNRFMKAGAEAPAFLWKGGYDGTGKHTADSGQGA